MDIDRGVDDPTGRGEIFRSGLAGESVPSLAGVVRDLVRIRVINRGVDTDRFIAGEREDEDSVVFILISFANALSLLILKRISGGRSSQPGKRSASCSASPCAIADSIVKLDRLAERDSNSDADFVR